MDFETGKFRARDCAGNARSIQVESITESRSPAAVAATIVPVVLSGGNGSRLWPYATEETPKQFLSFTGATSLFQMTLDRVRDRNRFAAPVIVANLRHAPLCERELGIGNEGARLLLEPCARNTAAAICMAAATVAQERGPDSLMLVMPSDHIIEDVSSFQSALARGEPAAVAGRLVTFGIQPTAPETGYGYIRLGEKLPGATGVCEAIRFVEKPPADSAQQMVASGDHLWNSGIFLFRAGTFLDEARNHAPAIVEAAELAVAAGERNGNRLVPDLAALSRCPDQSVDHAVMEKSSRVAVVPMAPGWSDLGSWDALAELVDETGQLGPITTLDCDDCYIRSDGLHIAALGVRDLIIVVSGQRLLILPRGRSQEVKKLLLAMDSMAA